MFVRSFGFIDNVRKNSDMGIHVLNELIIEINFYKEGIFDFQKRRTI